MSSRQRLKIAARCTAVLICAVFALAAEPAAAEDCSQYPNGILDGFAGTPAPSQLYIDQNCTIRNYPNGFSTNISFSTQPGQTNERWLVIFDNVAHTGQMACNAVAGHRIWFVNGSSTGIHANCQNLLIPVEKIDKQNPAGQTTASIGVPFKYKLTSPVLFAPGTGTVINYAGSVNDLHSVTMVDDLNTTGVALTYIGHTAVWLSSGQPVPHTFTNVGGVLTFDNFPIIPAGEQIIIELELVLDNSPLNVIGTQFINTAKWDFGRLIDDIFYEPLPGEWGISPPLTIAGPDLVVTKTGPATIGRTLNLGEWGQFAVNVHNSGLGDAWNATIVDRLPHGATGGMCNVTPQILSARVFQADGITPVTGKGPLVTGTDFSLTYAPAPNCQLTLNMLTPAAMIGPNERLIVSYQTQLDADSDDGATLTNVAGATQWFNGSSNNAARVSFVRTLTDGTVGVLDFQDAHTVTVALRGYFFEKTVADLTTAANPATSAAPGDTLRYTLRLQTTDGPVSNVSFHDDLGAMNPTAVFVPGSLTLVAGTIPAGADTSNTDPNGGTNGAGILDLRNLSLPAASEVVIQFDVRLVSALPNATVVTNQAQLLAGAAKLADSDDPNVNGQSDPSVAGDEDPTRVQILSVAYFDVDKISTDLDGDPAVLLAGERLRYTIAAKNVGTSSVTDAMLRDAVPANTTYVAGSTTLNGNAVPDAAGGVSPLSSGIALSAPENPTPGVMRADASATTANMATITFVVRIDPAVADGTVISNQGFVSAIAGGVSDQPSDDPRTPEVNDPTRNVVGNFPVIYAEKSAALQVDNGSPGIVDPGDYLRYTIRVHNNGAVAANMARLTDVAPNDTTYVADTLTLNGLPVGQPDNGVFPMAAGMWISSSDRTPPVPGPNDGVLSPGGTATIQFDVRVNDATPRGTLLINQATVTTEKVGPVLTDGDGNPATGPEPTVVVVGDAQGLTITKQVSVVGGGAAVAGATLEYLVIVRNVAMVPATGVYVTDDLDETLPGQLVYVDQSALLGGTMNGISVAGTVITANYSSVYGPLAPGQSFVLRFRAQLYPNLAIGTTVTNVAHVTWNTDQTAYASVAIDVGGVPGSGILNGTAWHDADFDNVLDATERVLEGWTVELRRNDQLIVTTTTDAAGVYRIAGLVPNYQTQDRYDLTFRAPGAGANTALLGLADSSFRNVLQRIYDIQVQAGSNLQNLNLPIDPDGVVYNSLSRAPLSGVTLRLVDANTHNALPTSCFDDPNQQGQVTRIDGYYKFDINFVDPSCPSGGSYAIDVIPPTPGYETGFSRVIPPPDATAPPFNVPTCPAGPDDAIPTTTDFCEQQTSEFEPATSVPAQSLGTAYQLRLVLNSSRLPGTSQLFNNHLPVDPTLTGVVTISKTTPMVNVTRGQMVPYTIAVKNAWQFPLTDVNVVDRYPVGFKYVEGSARFDDQPLDPTVAEGQLVWSHLTLAAEGEHTIKLLLAPGAGVTEGKFTNYAHVMHNPTGQALSGQASATVRIVPDPTFDCTDVTGKVFNDHNRNGIQEEGEAGIAAARLVSPTGLAALTDSHGRFHITCAITPHEGRGSNFMLKLDNRSLPTGYRASTDAFQIERATRGKALHFSFGASIHKVIGLDVADAVFVPGSTEMRPQWRPRVNLLIEELRKGPAVLRLSYLADVEDPKLVEQRVEAMTQLVSSAWGELHCCYKLVVEHEVFWRMGKPPGEDERLSALHEADR